MKVASSRDRDPARVKDIKLLYTTSEITPRPLIYFPFVKHENGEAENIKHRVSLSLFAHMKIFSIQQFPGSSSLRSPISLWFPKPAVYA